jgi:hypothetical protein
MTDKKLDQMLQKGIREADDALNIGRQARKELEDNQKRLSQKAQDIQKKYPLL